MGANRHKTQRRAKSQEFAAATITILNAPGMTKQGRADIAAWLRRHAWWLVKSGPKYTSGRFRGRYLVARKVA